MFADKIPFSIIPYIELATTQITESTHFDRRISEWLKC